MYPQDVSTSPAVISNDDVMGNLLSKLFMARNCAHVHHWKTKSFSAHLALGELYELLTEMADELAEMYMGKLGTELRVPQSDPNGFDELSAMNFVAQLTDFLEQQHDAIPQFPWLINKFEELQGDVSRIRYKLENLG